MASVTKLREDIDVTKRELKNLRQEIRKQNAVMKSELNEVLSLFCVSKDESVNSITSKTELEEEKSKYWMTPIGYISSCFKFKNGIPRQPSLCPSAKGTLKIEKSVFNNPEHSLIGLEEFSHVWILFLFHENENVGVKAKVHPPRLNGTSVGVFSTRSPHRPSPVGMSLTKLDKIEGDTLYLSGIDLLDGTPVIDIKPYIPMYDNPFIEVPDLKSNSDSKSDAPDCDTGYLERGVSNLKVTSGESVKVCVTGECKIPEFLREPPKTLEVLFTSRALKDLENVQVKCANDNSQCMKPEEVKRAITEVLQNDPRSIYRREKCSDKLYYFYIDNVHVTSWFDNHTAEVLRIKLSDVT